MKITELKISDPEFAERFEAFANEEVVNEPGIELEEKTRYLAILATLLGCQGIEAFKVVLKEALYGAVTPVEAKEVVYQAVDYLGMGRVFPFINATNEVMTELGIELPLSGQTTTTMENRVEMGEQAQVDIFGEGMKGFSKGGHINRWLSGNCFGDYYTRKGLDLKQRELITFCYIVAQGGCEPQLIAHAKGNMNLGNDKEFLMKVVSQCLPYIGYPRSLNAITCINKAAE
ncbi:carboxymuconolactone decarboxylase family protein [Cellulosilyticum sp. WCF-2]|uniref:carboxymuconolactone decarboxylase family protein n=1 Tax=Cellulosilyticum sp. WCF-2 TaxID=2497860 RepID=UPI000F8EBFC3|nr:carboxymuconolactone decarboxylase family protein [Cellulosilyticum sp. WCF-2]QEH70481.1 carboxymuconolactone decarboxylase [Cellulosilyticum sp. WCF-2]